MLIEVTTLRGEVVSLRADLISYFTKCKGGTSIALADNNYFSVKESYDEIVSKVEAVLSPVHTVKN